MLYVVSGIGNFTIIYLAFSLHLTLPLPYHPISSLFCLKKMEVLKAGPKMFEFGGFEVIVTKHKKCG